VWQWLYCDGHLVGCLGDGDLACWGTSPAEASIAKGGQTFGYRSFWCSAASGKAPVIDTLRVFESGTMVEKLGIPSLKQLGSCPVGGFFLSVIRRVAPGDKNELVVRDESNAEVQLIQIDPPRVIEKRLFTQKDPHRYPIGLILTRATADGTAFTVCDEGKVWAVRFSDGATLWSLNLPDAGPWRALPTPPSVSEAMVLINNTTGEQLALSLADGKTLWRANQATFGECAAVDESGRQQVFISADGVATLRKLPGGEKVQLKCGDHVDVQFACDGDHVVALAKLEKVGEDDESIILVRKDHSAYVLDPAAGDRVSTLSFELKAPH
jgi:hypothetical protein